MENNISRLFVDFLLEHNAYKSYCRNLYHRLRDDQAVNNFIKRHLSSPRGLINVAFIWSSSQEGGKYWSKLHDKWCAILEEGK